ncbi:sn-1-specific diacylglycerol lipase ABHD11 isoform X2 [Hydra vulgaris]|uniref:sn-1-specific diacylglycerol lipase ABHD11 n=1 Tax=Hydra vulgaris TaxID=6087 RepID=A0ABM4CNV0_HYDVU
MSFNKIVFCGSAKFLLPITQTWKSCILQHSYSTKFQTRDVTLDYDLYNQTISNLDPIIVSHGLFGSKKNWRSLCKRINELTGRMVVAFDSVNHGSSSHHSDMSFEAMVYDLQNLLKKLQIKKSILVGHSMGGMLVMTAALMNPSDFSKLVVVDVAPTGPKSLIEILKYMNAMSNIDLLSMKKRKDIEEELGKSVESKQVLQFLMGNLDFSQGQFTWKCNLPALIQTYSTKRSFPEFQDDVTFSKPTLFIAGGLSQYITEEDYPLIKKRFPNSSIQRVPDAGHWVHADKPTDFLNLLTKFVA